MAKYSTEILHHFHCENPECKQWWTIAHDFINPAECDFITCPICKAEQQVTEDNEQ